jgi:Putative ParB-like nuclease
MPETTSIASLRPTQMTLGMLEVKKRKHHIAKLTDQALTDYLDARLVTAVLAPDSQRYIIDRHHLCRALLELGNRDVKCETICDASHLAEDEFGASLTYVVGCTRSMPTANVRRSLPCRVASTTLSMIRFVPWPAFCVMRKDF